MVRKRMFCYYHATDSDGGILYEMLCEFLGFTTNTSLPGQRQPAAKIVYLEDCEEDGIAKGSTVFVHPSAITFISDEHLENLKRDGFIPLPDVANMEKINDDQTIKADAGKPKLTLVPQQIIFDIAEVREYGLKKYGKSESWKNVDIQRYRDASFRHFLAYLRDPDGVDEESGISHLSHLACNIAFLCEMEHTKIEKENKDEN